MLDRKLGGILEIYEKFQGVDPRSVTPMKIFPAVHYSMGGLWVDYEKSATGGLEEGSVRNQQTNVSPASTPSANATTNTTGPTGSAPTRCSRVSSAACSCAPTLVIASVAGAKKGGEDSSRLFDAEIRSSDEEPAIEALLARTAGNENPYDLHQELGNLMTRVATVVRRNDQLAAAYDEVCTDRGAVAAVLAVGYAATGRTRTSCSRRRSATCFRSPS
jgi:succinate dehydrogenase / fumarate reductase, flavoprotein subunit